MRRSVLTILIVAALSAWIARAERAAGIPELRYAAPNHPEWVRTADGWQHRAVLKIEPRTPAIEIHPGLIAAFQLVFSLAVLVAFPGKAVPVRRAGANAPRRRSTDASGFAPTAPRERRRTAASVR